MSKSTPPTDLLHPAAAMALWAELRPDPPPTAHAFHTRAERLGVRPHMVDRVRHYSAAEIEAAILGREARAALDLARIVKLGGELGFTIHLDAVEDDPPAVEILIDGDDVGPCYSGHLAGARRWLEDVVSKYLGEIEAESAEQALEDFPWPPPDDVKECLATCEEANLGMWYPIMAQEDDGEEAVWVWQAVGGEEAFHEDYKPDRWRPMPKAPERADALYRLVGPDPDRIKTALTVLDLIEAATAAEVQFIIDTPDEPGRMLVSLILPDDNPDEPSHRLWTDMEGLGASCRRLLEQLRDPAE